MLLQKMILSHIITDFIIFVNIYDYVRKYLCMLSTHNIIKSVDNISVYDYNITIK